MNMKIEIEYLQKGHVFKYLKIGNNESEQITYVHKQSTYNY